MAEVKRYGPGRGPRVTVPGDFVLTHRNRIPSRLIALGQGVRFRGERRVFAHWSHVALLVGHDGQLVEALGGGVLHTNLTRYDDVEFHVVHLEEATSTDRLRVVAFGLAMAERHELYDWAEILSLGLQLVTGARLTITTAGHLICSSLVATALERTGAIFPKSAGCMYPADLAEWYGVRP